VSGPVQDAGDSKIRKTHPGALNTMKEQGTETSKCNAKYITLMLMLMGY